MDINRAKVPVTDRGLLYGHGTFETMRAFNGAISTLERHLNRLNNSLQRLSIDVRFSEGKTRKIINRLLRVNGLKDAYIRITVTAGTLGESFADKKTKNPTVFIIAKNPPHYSKKYYENGVRAAIASIRRNNHSYLTRLKTTSYLENILSKIEAKRKNAFESLFLDIKGNVAEGASSNIFIVKKGVLYTPALSMPILPGVTRQVVVELAKKLSIKVIQKKISLGEFMKADEVFITNSTMGLMPVSRIGKCVIGRPRDYKVYKRLRKSSENS